MNYHDIHNTFGCGSRTADFVLLHSSVHRYAFSCDAHYMSKLIYFRFSFTGMSSCARPRSAEPAVRHAYYQVLILNQNKTPTFVGDLFWLREQDSNLRPRGYEPRELPLLHPATLVMRQTERFFSSRQASE